MAFKVNVQGVFTPLLDAINASKTGGNSSVEITYSLGPKLKASTKENSAFKSGLSYTEVMVDVDNAFNVWKSIFNLTYQKNSKNKSALQVTFKEVKKDSDITISLKSLSKGTLMNVTASSIELDPNNDWVLLRAVKGLNIFNYLSYGIGRLLGLNSISGVSILNPNLLSESFVVRLGIKVEQSGSIVDFTSFSTATSAVTSFYGSNSSNLPLIYGCLDPTSSNYNSAATADDGSCEESVVVSSRRLRTTENSLSFAGNPNVAYTLNSNGTFAVHTIDPELPVSYNNTSTSAIFRNENGDITLYMVVDDDGVTRVFNTLGEPVSNLTVIEPPGFLDLNEAPLYLDPDLVDGNSSNIKIGEALVSTYVNNSNAIGAQPILRSHIVDTSAHQIDSNGNVAINCDTELPLGNFDSSNDIFSTTLRSIGLTAGFTSYEDFITSAIDLIGESNLIYPITLAEVAIDTDIEYYITAESVGSRKLATFKNFLVSGNNGPYNGDYYDNVTVVFDMYSSNLYATYGLEPVTKRVRMNNGRPNGDGTYDYRYTLGATYSKTDSSVTYDTMIISTFEGFTFDMYEYGIYGLSGKKWNSTDSTFTTPGVDAEVNLANPTDHQKLISQLPVVIGGRLFEDIGGDTRRSEIGRGGYYSKGLWDSITTLSPSPTGNEVGYYNVAYAVKHGFILMRMYSYSPFLLRPDDGGIEAHICGGDPTDAGVISAGGYTPISMTFSKYNNYLYAILRDPDTMDKYIGIYDITSGVASTISADVKMVSDPLESGASRIITVGDAVFILSKNSSDHIRINNADTFQAVTAFTTLPFNHVITNGPSCYYLPADTENEISLTDDASIDIGVYTILNSYELSSYITTPRGLLNINNPTEAAGLSSGTNEWHASAAANDNAGNLLFTVQVPNKYAVEVYDREGNFKVSMYSSIGAINTSSDSCVVITPTVELNTYKIIISVNNPNELYVVSTVTFTEGINLSTTSPTNLDLGTFTQFQPFTALTPETPFLPVFLTSAIKGRSIYSKDPLAAVSMYISKNNESLIFTLGFPAVNELTINQNSALNYSEIDNTCFTTYTDASTVAVAMHTEDAFEIQIIDVLSKPMAAIKTMSNEAVGALSTLAANQNFNVARLEFSQDKNWLYVLLRDKELDIVNNPSKLLKVYIGNATILAQDVSELDEFDYELAFIGQEVPDSFTEDANGVLDYVDNNLRSKSHLSGMFKAADGNIYTLFVNDGTVVPTLGIILNQNSSSAKHAPASIRKSDTLMNLGLYSPSLDLSHSGITFDPGTDIPITDKISGCTNPDACNFDALANFDDGSCAVPEEGCDCNNPTAYSVCDGCYDWQDDTPDFTIIGGVSYEPCEYCPDPAATNYNEEAVSEEGSVPNSNMCIYARCNLAMSIDGAACNGTTDTTGNWEHEESLCVYAFTGCECDGVGGLQNINSGGSPTHCIECSEYQEGIISIPEIIPESDPVCGCGEEPIIDGWCDCTTPYPDNYCDCDGNPNPGFCNGCSGDLESTYCGCGEDLLEEYQSNVGESGICDCEGTPKILYYQDSEGDGLGNPAISEFYCEGTQPEGWVINNTDTNLECPFDENFEGYQNYQTGEFISGDVDAAGECNGNAFINGCGFISYNNSNTSGLNIHGCCGGNSNIQDCLTGECVPTSEATQNTSGGCECGYLPSNDPNCSQCVPADQVDTIWECDNCQNISEGDCDCFGHVEDECGVCGSEVVSCAGCMDPIAENYNPEAIVEGPCDYLTLTEVLDESVNAGTSNTIVDALNFETPFALYTGVSNEVNITELSPGYTIEEIDGINYYKDQARITEKCQVISETNTTLICSNPLYNAENTFRVFTPDSSSSGATAVITNPSTYNNINMPPGTFSEHTALYYFRITEEFLSSLELESTNIAAIFSNVSHNLAILAVPNGEAYWPHEPEFTFNGIGNIQGGVNYTVTNTGEGIPTSLPQYHIYEVRTKYNEETGSHEEFELDFTTLSEIPIVLPCGGEDPTPICCESSGVQNPGAFTTNADGELVADNECEVCAGVCIPEEVTTMEVCCDTSAINTVVDYNGDIHVCNNSLCNYNTPEISGLRIKMIIHTEGLESLEDLKWILYSKSGSIINQSDSISLGEAVGGVIIKEIQLSSYADCMWFLPIGFEYNDVWKHVHLEILNSDIVTSEGVESEVVHSLLYGASPTKGGSVKINLGNSECLLGCSETTLQTEYCQKAIREDHTEFTDIILQVNTAAGDNNSFTGTSIEIINVNTGATLSYLETLTSSTEYVKTFRVITDTKIGIKVINPNEGKLVYKLLSEFGDLITIKEV